jgi:hypothetical protein
MQAEIKSGIDPITSQSYRPEQIDWSAGSAISLVYQLADYPMWKIIEIAFY